MERFAGVLATGHAMLRPGGIKESPAVSPVVAADVLFCSPYHNDETLAASLALRLSLVVQDSIRQPLGPNILPPATWLRLDSLFDLLAPA